MPLSFSVSCLSCLFHLVFPISIVPPVSPPLSLVFPVYPVSILSPLPLLGILSFQYLLSLLSLPCHLSLVSLDSPVSPVFPRFGHHWLKVGIFCESYDMQAILWNVAKLWNPLKIMIDGQNWKMTSKLWNLVKIVRSGQLWNRIKTEIWSILWNVTILRIKLTMLTS